MRGQSWTKCSELKFQADRSKMSWGCSHCFGKLGGDEQIHPKLIGQGSVRGRILFTMLFSVPYALKLILKAPSPPPSRKEADTQTAGLTLSLFAAGEERGRCFTIEYVMPMNIQLTSESTVNVLSK